MWPPSQCFHLNLLNAFGSLKTTKKPYLIYWNIKFVIVCRYKLKIICFFVWFDFVLQAILDPLFFLPIFPFESSSIFMTAHHLFADDLKYSFCCSNRVFQKIFLGSRLRNKFGRWRNTSRILHRSQYTFLSFTPNFLLFLH